MLSNIKDRTGEIGILRAMGVRGADVSKMFVIQALCLIVVGVLLCTLFIFGFTALLNGILYDGFLARHPQVLLDEIPILTVTAWPFLLTFMVMSGVLLLSTALPTARLVRMKPAKCIQKG
jgi:putative ABC transport system permease protein